MFLRRRDLTGEIMRRHLSTASSAISNMPHLSRRISISGMFDDLSATSPAAGGHTVGDNPSAASSAGGHTNARTHARWPASASVDARRVTIKVPDHAAKVFASC